MSGTEDVINQLGALSYGGIWLVSFLSNVVIPIPEEIVLLALGYLSGTGAINGFVVIPLVISALLINDIVIYKLSRRGSKITSYLYTRFFEKRVKKKGELWLNMNIKRIIFFSRFLMQLRFIGPFLAGSKKMPQKEFIIADFLALAVYVPLYVGLGWYFHSRVLLIIKDVGIAKNIILLVVGAVIAAGLVKFIYRFVTKPGQVD